MSSLLEAYIKGYFTRKYKRGFPINKPCDFCPLHIKGTIHREEKINDTDIILYKSSIRPNKGVCSFSKNTITIAKKINDKYLCENCIGKNTNIINNKKCSICLEDNINIITKCNHTFHNSCLINWIKHENNCSDVFNATCPICRQKL